MRGFLNIILILLSFFIVTSVVMAADPTPTITGVPTATPSPTPVCNGTTCIGRDPNAIPPTPRPTSAPFPTSAPTGICGAAGQICCNGLNIENPDVRISDDPICFPIIIGEICLDEIIDHARNDFVDIFLNSNDVDQNDLTSLETCKEGVPVYKNDIQTQKVQCYCESQATPGSSIKMCEQYIFPEVARRMQREKKSRLDYDSIKADPEYQSCFNCFEHNGYWSALGCIYLDNWKSIIEKNLFGTAIGLGGIFAFGCIIYAAIQMQLSQGNAEVLKKTNALLTSCITGLMLIIFSLFILRLIGVDILKIPGFQ